MKSILRALTCLLFLSFACLVPAAPPVTAADVGDTGSFGRASKYMGVASGFVRLLNDCTVAPGSPPDDVCIDITPAPGSTAINATNICRVRLPKKATKSIVYPIITIFHTYQLRNDTGVDQPNALFNYFVAMTIESDALLDPSYIDPSLERPERDGIPSIFGRYRDDRTWRINERSRQQQNYTRSGNAGINKESLIAQGIPVAVVNALFRRPDGDQSRCERQRARFLTDGSITGNLRLFGD